MYESRIFRGCSAGCGDQRGPAGLTAAYELVARYGITSPSSSPTTSSAASAARVERDGWRFDIGGHRFFTKVKEVEALWHEILPDEDFMLRPRMSRILLQGQVLRLSAQGHRTR